MVRWRLKHYFSDFKIVFSDFLTKNAFKFVKSQHSLVTVFISRKKCSFFQHVGSSETEAPDFYLLHYFVIFLYFGKCSPQESRTEFVVGGRSSDINKFIFLLLLPCRSRSMCLSWQTCQKMCQVHLGNDRNGGLFLSPPFRKFAKITQSLCYTSDGQC